MKYSDEFVFAADNLILFEGPVNELDQTPITNTPPVTSAKARLFHDGKDDYLTQASSVGLTLLHVSNPENFTPNGDRVVVWMNDGTWHEGGIVTAIDVEAGTITITNAIPGNTNRDHPVRAVLGNNIGSADPWEIDMVYFEPASGAVAGNFDYGWRVIVPDTQAGFEIGITCRVEMEIDAAANLKGKKIIKRPIVGGV